MLHSEEEFDGGDASEERDGGTGRLEKVECGRERGKNDPNNIIH